MKSYSTLLLLICFCRGINAQSDSLYEAYIEKADHYYNTKEFTRSAKFYKMAFNQYGGKAYDADRYNAACSYALAGINDTAMFHLNKLAYQSKYSNYQHITTDTDLNSLHNREDWQVLIDKVKANKEELEKDFNKPLLRRLDSLKELDQKWRHISADYTNGKLDSTLYTREQIMQEVRKRDSLNYIELQDILDKHGFPGFSLVGKQGSNNFWLMVQHQDRHPEFQVKVLDMMKVEMDKNNASKTNYAYLIDRVNLNTGKQQIYGTQMQINEAGDSYEPKDLFDPENLNKRRAIVNLPPIETYIEIMNSTYGGALKKKTE